MPASSDFDARAAATMRRRAADWAAGAARARTYDRARAAAMSINERLAEGVELTRLAEALQASVRPQRPGRARGAT